MQNLSSSEFINDFTRTFDGDKSGNPQPRQTPGVLYSLVNPSPVKQPQLIAWTTDLAQELNIHEPNQNDINILGGNLVTPSMQPYAACYAGHQFGNWAGQLGDGRAITLGEWPLPNKTSWELQLKGAGLTPYSRRADGRAVLRSSVREYLMSEAMFHLGVPTTRALSLVSTGDQVMRDMFYDGRPAYEKGAVVMRAAPSFLRFGSFEMLAARKEYENLQKLVDWTIERFYPHILTPEVTEKDHQLNEENQLSKEHHTLQWFKEVVEKTATMIVEWLRVGFVHGVMNTDNMSILGLTIDYGPYSFLDAYDPEFSPNTTDHPGRRYAFGKQHSIAYWNLGCLANAIAPLFKDTKELISALESFGPVFYEKFYAMKAGKMGLDQVTNEDIDLIDQFESLLYNLQPDMTIFYQLLIYLSENTLDQEEVTKHFSKAFYQEPRPEQKELLHQQISRYQLRLKQNKTSFAAAQKQMRTNNPRFILRNYLLYQAIQELEKGEDQLFKRLQEALKDPYSDKHDEFFKLRPDWANEQPGSATLSCSS